MKSLIYGSVFLLICISTSTTAAYSQNNSTGLNFDEPVSQLATDLANYHLKLGLDEQAKGNLEGAKYHFGLAGMSQNDLSQFIDRVLDNQQKQNFITNGPGNCIISSNVTVLCMR